MTRYDIEPGLNDPSDKGIEDEPCVCITPEPNGEWVRFADVAAAWAPIQALVTQWRAMVEDDHADYLGPVGVAHYCADQLDAALRAIISPPQEPT